MTTHRLFGELTCDVGELTSEGYPVRVTCSGGAVVERRVAPETAEQDLLRSRLLAYPN